MNNSQPTVATMVVIPQEEWLNLLEKIDRLAALVTNSIANQTERDGELPALASGKKSGRQPRRILYAGERLRRDEKRQNKNAVDEVSRPAFGATLFSYMERIIAKLNKNGKIRTAEAYNSALNSFKTFRKDEEIRLDFLNSETMEAYEAWHHLRGITPNTISFYMRILRAV